MANAQQILTLEVKDKKIQDLFVDLRSRFNRVGKIPSSPHVTIRGPYKTAVSSRRSKQIMQRLSHEPKLRLSGVGRFELPDCHVVYLSVQGEVLRKVWWKPDFPIHQFGFNPHITVFKGDKEAADRVFEELSNHTVDHSIESFELKIDVIGQAVLNFGS